MPDNVNITVNETIENVVVNPSITTEVIDVNITATTEEVNIDVTPNLTTVNINTITGNGLVTSVNGEIGDVVLTIPTNTSDLINDGEDGVHPFITLEDIPPVTGFVPYTGATQDVNLGEFGIQLGNLEFDLTPTNAPTGVGSMFWNDTAGTLDLKLKGGAVTLQIGQETVARVVNKTATNITLLEANYQIVRVTGAQGQRPKVDLALANNDLNSTTTLGLVTETIANNQEGFITTSGQVQQINTTGSLQGETWVDGDVLYLSGTVAGQATNIKPAAPIHTVIIGFVEYAHINQGKIFVKVDNGYELEELHNVSAIAPNNNEVLTYDTPTLLWKPKTIASALGYTPFQLPSLTSGSVLFSDGTTIAQKNSNFFWDNTNNRLGIGTNAPVAKFQTITDNRTNDAAYSNQINQLAGSSNQGLLVSYSSTLGSYINSIFPGSAWLNTTYGAKNHIFQLGGVTQLTLTQNSTILIGTTVDQGGKLQIKAPGALSTDIALRVRNSADTGDLMTVAGNGTSKMIGNSTEVSVNSNATVNGVGRFIVINPYASSGPMGYLIRNGGQEGGRFVSDDGTGNLVIQNSWDTYGMVFNTGGANTRMFISGSLGNIGIGTTTPVASAKVQIDSTTQGFLPPRMTTTQKNAIATPASGLVVYDTTLGKLCVRGAASWETITSL